MAIPSPCSATDYAAAIPCRSKHPRTKNHIKRANNFTIIGRRSKGFRSSFAGLALDVWTPVMMKATWHVRIFRSRIAVVVADGHGPAQARCNTPQAQANIAAIADHLQRITRKPMSSWVWRFTRGAVAVQLEGGAKTALAILMAAVAVVAHDCLRQMLQLVLTPRCLTARKWRSVSR